MTLADLVRAIDAAPSPTTVADLARRARVPAAEVAGMLAALRASGMVENAEGASPVCGSSAACRTACPGAGQCPLVVSTGVQRLRIRRR
jgi:hypothetical protein